MSIKKLDVPQDYSAKLPRTSFDLSHSFTFTSAPGMILPVFDHMLNAGERIDFDCSMFTRLTPALTAAMADVEFKIDCFFVPLSMIYTLFPSTVLLTNDVISSQFVDGNGMVISTADSPYPHPKQPNFNYANFGNNFEADGLNYTEATTSAEDLEYYDGFECERTSLMRLLQHLGYNSMGVFNLGYHGAYHTLLDSVPMWNLWAYQCIYQNYYRNDDWEFKDVNSYNIDYYVNEAMPNSMARTSRTAGMFKLRYHQRPKDYFTSLFVNPISSPTNIWGFNDPFSGSTDSVSLKNLLLNVNSYLSEDANSQNVLITDPDNAGNNTKFMTNVRDDSELTTNGIRIMFAYEKLLRILGRARKNYDDQILAHFGYRPPVDVKHDLSMLGGYKGSMHIGEVVSTASTETGELGEIAGRGTGNLSGSRIKFTAPVHGIFMAVCYSLVHQSYTYGLTQDKSKLLRSRNDLYFPEFDRLGMQPLFGYEIGNFSTSVQNSRIMGWQYRYAERKRTFNRNSIAFASPRNDNQANFYQAWILGRNEPFREGVFSSGYDLNYKDFLQKPTDINHILQVPYDGNIHEEDAPWLRFQTDPFIHKLSITCYKVSTMSEFGEPNLD